MKSTVQPVPNEGDENTGEEADSKLRKRAIIVMLGTLGVISGVAVIATSSALSAKHNPDTQNARQGELLKSTKLQSDIDECLSDPCLHGGTCESTRVGYICHCTTLYEGMLCEIETDECQSGPCLNGGTCEDMLGGYVCHCIVPYGGRLCEIENTCLPNPCMNGGSCVFNVADETHACSCVRGFTGRACEINIDDCLTDDVCFGGQCVDGVNGFHCNCSGANGTTLTNIARNKWAIQSSTHQDNYAGRAVDDVINPDSSGGLSCAITGNQTGEAGWWKVDLGQVYCVSRVTISTPQDCCAGSISEAEVRVSRHYDMSDPNVCGIVHDTMASDWLIDIECALGAVGRYLEIRRLLGDRESLALCEVKVMVPEGFHEIPPVADSVECPSDWKPFGDKCYYFGTNQLTWADADVYCQSQGGDLAKDTREVHDFLSSEVAKLNTDGCSPLWICHPFIGLVYTPGEGYQWSDGSAVDVSCMPWKVGEPNNGNVKKSVELVISTPDKSWNDRPLDYYIQTSRYICQKAVTANVAFGRLTWQSSSHPNGPADKAVDGYSSGHFEQGKCTLSGSGDSHPWWRVDLAEPHRIERVVIFTRTDCCGEGLVGGKVFVSKNAALSDAAQCGPTVTYSMSRQSSIDFLCDQGSVGRFVHFKQTDQASISLCEVKVYAPARGRYQLVMVPETPSDAQAYCATQSVGGQLARITSLDQHDYVVGLIRQSRREDEADYWWVDGRYLPTNEWMFSDNSTILFSAWHSSVNSIIGEAQCVRLSKQDNYLWDAAPCSDAGYFVCRYDG